MSIAFSCHFCSRKYRVDDGLAGRKVKCKECGTELSIPTPRTMATASRPSAQGGDLYGLDDEAPLPPPRRPGMVVEKPKSSRSRRNSGADGGDQWKRSGISLLIFGAGAVILPLIGLQWRLLSFLPPAAQIGLGMLMLLGGMFCLLTSSMGFLKALGFSVLGLVVGIPAFLVLVGIGLEAAGVQPPQPGNNGGANVAQDDGGVPPPANPVFIPPPAPPAPIQPPNFGQQPGNPNFGQPQGPNFGQPQGPNFGQPQNPNFGQPQNPNFGQPQGPNFGQQPGNPNFGQPQGPNFGRINRPNFGRPPGMPSMPRGPQFGPRH